MVGGPWKSIVALEKSLKNGCNFFCMNPVYMKAQASISLFYLRAYARKNYATVEIHR